MRVLMKSIVLSAAAYMTPCNAHDIVSRGMWIEGAAGFQASGIAVAWNDRLWLAGDQNSTLANNTEHLATIVARENQPQIRRQSNSGLDGDFEGLHFDTESNLLFAVTEENYNGSQEMYLVKFDEEGNTVGDQEISFPTARHRNARLEGITVVGERMYLAYESPAQILSVEKPATEDTDPLLPTVSIDLSDYVDGINGLTRLFRGNKTYLIALSRNSNAVVILEVAGHTLSVQSTREISFMSPENPTRQICWASPEGITHADGVFWIVSDPAPPREGGKNYRELRQNEVHLGCSGRSTDAPRRENFEDMVPILFQITEDELFPNLLSPSVP